MWYGVDLWDLAPFISICIAVIVSGILLVVS
jgi:hypothetical protein